ncbi:sialidase family protein [Tundrisphaera lichenicola]|uniref:sialidase family protein n=1 Tax=Tundrisphaera lichenicola TaxID=2029860 RepID=UPI003EBE12B4
MAQSAPIVRVATLVFVVGLLANPETARAEDDRFSTDVFESGTGGYHTYRIPALLVTARGTLLAFCEGRKTGRSDHGDIDLLLRRSVDGGRNWGPPALVHEEGGDEPVTIGNPCPVLDASTGTIWLTFCRDNKDVLVTSSEDDGQTWTPPRTITEEVKKPEWGWYATGPGVGIQLTKGPHAGRLVIPSDHRESVDGKQVMFSHVFFSDDHGQTWSIGGTVDQHTDECQVAELADGELLINMRNYWGKTGGQPEKGAQRAIARSRDGGATWSPIEFDDALIEPICQASLIAIPRPDRSDQTLLVFSNPASATNRRNMTVRVSGDGGRTWPVTLPIDPGSAAYSCLAPLSHGRVGLLYEAGKSEKIKFTELPIPWPGETQVGDQPRDCTCREDAHVIPPC